MNDRPEVRGVRGVGYVSNAGFEVEAQRRGITGLEFRIHQTRNVTQAWHQEDGEVTYSVDFSAINEGTRPVWVDASYFDSADSALGVSAVATATKALEGHIGDVFSENDSSYEVTIKPAWIFSGGGVRFVEGHCMCEAAEQRILRPPHERSGNVVHLPPSW